MREEKESQKKQAGNNAQSKGSKELLKPGMDGRSSRPDPDVDAAR